MVDRLKKWARAFGVDLLKERAANLESRRING